MAELDGKKGNEVCLRCHDRYRGDEPLRAHAHHAPDGPGGVCMNCHMPKKNLSLEVRLGRYHRIGSPNDPVRVERDRPVECALCHADQSVRALVEQMERWWGKRYDRAALAKLYGDLSQNALVVTLAGGKPHEQAVAIAVLGATRDRAHAPSLARQLTHTIPMLRGYALAGLEQIIGEPAPIDLHRDNTEIADAARRWLSGKGIAVDVVAPAATPASRAAPDDE
jgi:hypothetical protein